MASARSGSGGIFAAGNGRSVTSGGPALAEGDRSNYNTFFTADESLRSLMRTSDNIERTRRTVAESEEVAKNVLVDLELQHSQLHEMKDKVAETSGLTGQVRRLLQRMATRSRRKTLCLYLVIAALIVTDLLVFYLLFVR